MSFHASLVVFGVLCVCGFARQVCVVVSVFCVWRIICLLSVIFLFIVVVIIVLPMYRYRVSSSLCLIVIVRCVCVCVLCVRSLLLCMSRSRHPVLCCVCSVLYLSFTSVN